MDDELIEYYAKKIKPNKEINDLYINEEQKKQKPAFNCDKEAFEKEDWKSYPDCEFLEVSNLGRVRTKKEIQTKDKIYSTNDILEQIDIGKDKGYLYLKHYKEIQSACNFRFTDNWVYQMVAKTWLGDVHHKSNDGYDNSVNNLMYVSREDHLEIHKRFKDSQKTST